MAKLVRRAGRAAINQLPWRLRRTAEHLIATWAVLRPPFRGVYKSFAEVPEQIPSDDQAISAVTRASLPQRDTGPLELGRLGRGQTLATVAAMLAGSNRAPLKILDFGGGGGADFKSLLAALGSDTKVSYRVVELPAVCAAVGPLWKGESRITYAPELPPVAERFDVAYAWSSIQYVPDPIVLLRELARRADRAVLIVGTSFSDKAFVRAQVNQSRPYPHWVISLPEAERAMAEEGFTLAFRAAGDEDYNMQAYSAEYRVPSSASLLFLRVS